jgi:nucleotide-binding universal stress UspA family protein
MVAYQAVFLTVFVESGCVDRCNRCVAFLRKWAYCMAMKTILAPIDFSNATDGVIAAAVDLAEATDGRVILLHIVQPPILTSDYGLAMESFQEAVALSEKHAVKRLLELRERAKAKYPNVDTEQVSGSAISEILNAALRHHADYLVMGSHGHTALYDLMVGSTTHGILRKVNCPVVIVPPAHGARK